MDISIIIVNYNSLDFIKRCIKSIEKLLNESSADCEVIIVDNNSSDGSVEYLKEKTKENDTFHLIVNDTNAGFSRASNTGALQAKGNYLLFLNPDTEIVGGRLEDLINFYTEKNNEDKDGEAGVIGAKILNMDGTIQFSARSFPTLARQFYESYFLYRIFRKSRIFGSYFLSWWDHESIREVDWLTGSFMFIKKDYFIKAGMFDEDYFMYSEDTDLCLKLHRMNFKNYYFPYFIIKHSDSGIASREPATREAEIWRSRRLYFKKNYSTAHAIALSALYLAGVLNRIIVFTILTLIKPGSENKNRLLSYFRVLKLYYGSSGDTGL
ncbi:MAG: glycosyltransferase family 2 protein [Candidatus Humimicrobiaceae bacterium]|nr:glycosyltransferase family 2 protein [Actinomycetota bacterium]MDD5600863.1 glycosyltransferase family 2 protein [Actinomycetota bacterium]MDY0027598.1 glycosyltransferase family 2 protein [Candidatus Humimicrobiaceae bacterium]